MRYNINVMSMNGKRVRAAMAALILALSLLAGAQPVRAQNPLEPNIIPTLPDLPKPGGETLTRPECFEISSDAPFPVHGSFFSNRYTRPDGEVAQHRFNFRLETNQKQQVCSSGPFFEGRQLQLTLRTLVPMFSCRTGIYGPIRIHGRRNPNGRNEMWAECLIPREP